MVAAVTMPVVAMISVVAVTVASVMTIGVAVAVIATVFAMLVLTVVVAIVVSVPAVAATVVLMGTVEVAVIAPAALMLAAARETSAIAVAGIEAVVDPAVEVTRAVEPGSGANEESVGEPRWAVIAVGRAVVRPVGEISIGAEGLRADVDGDGNARGVRLRSSRKSKGCDERDGEKFDSLHMLSFRDGVVFGGYGFRDSQTSCVVTLHRLNQFNRLGAFAF